MVRALSRALPAALAALCLVGAARTGEGADRIDRRAVQDLGKRWFEARPRTRFAHWDRGVRAALLEEARALGPIPEGSLEEVRDLLWKAAQRASPRVRDAIATPYGEATWIQSGRGGRRAGLLLGLHGGGEGAGSASEPAGTWTLPGHLGMYPQGIRLVHDTWNTVHGEAFLLTLIEIAKVVHEVDPDRVYVAGFSMGGTGSWHLAGRHPDLLAGAIPAHGVLMASPRSQVETAAEVEALQPGLLPNVRNLAVHFYTGLLDRNCQPGTFLHAADRLRELAAADPGGYADVRFQAHPGLAHAFPPGEPGRGLKWVAEKRRDARPRKIVWEYAADPFPLPGPDDLVERPRKHWMYWLHCTRPVDRMSVTATREGNAIDLSVGVAFPEDFEILLDPSMIDVAEDVVVRANGKEVWRGRPVPDVATVLETLDARLDRTLTFDRRVRLEQEEAPATGS